MISFKVSLDKPIVRALLDESGIKAYIEEVVSNGEKNAFRAITSGGRSGAKYPNLPNRSSAPGEAPANQSGALAGSLDSGATGPRTGEITESAFHAQFLEQGSPGDPPKIAPRPHMLPGLQKAIAETELPKPIINLTGGQG